MIFQKLFSLAVISLMGSNSLIISKRLLSQLYLLCTAMEEPTCMNCSVSNPFERYIYRLFMFFIVMFLFYYNYVPCAFFIIFMLLLGLILIDIYYCTVYKSACK